MSKKRSSVMWRTTIYEFTNESKRNSCRKCIYYEKEDDSCSKTGAVISLIGDNYCRNCKHYTRNIQKDMAKSTPNSEQNNLRKSRDSSRVEKREPNHQSNVIRKVVEPNCIVKLYSESEKEHLEIKIVERNADVLKNEISTKSPLGQKLIGCRKGHVVNHNEFKYKILDFKVIK